MTMGKKLKISSSAYRVLLLLQKLNENDYSVDDLNSFFLEDPYIARFFSKNVILKYINTLRVAGYDIAKPTAANGYSYKLNNSPVNIKFSDDEINTLALLKRYTRSLHQKCFMENYSSFLQKLKRYMAEEVKEKLENYCKSYEESKDKIFTRYDHYAELIKKVEQFISEKQRVEIKCKLPGEETEKLVLTELQSIRYEPDEVSILCYNIVASQINAIKLSYILDVKQLPTISKINQVLCPVIFKLKGKLTEIYRPYEGEKLTRPDNKGHITVTAYSDDVESLLKRIFRYGDSCEILYPKLVRDKMAGLIKSTLENYK